MTLVLAHWQIAMLKNYGHVLLFLLWIIYDDVSKQNSRTVEELQTGEDLEGTGRAAIPKFRSRD